LIESKKYTGNLTKLNIAIALRNERPILETRLDADDGLHEHFIKYIQAVALKRFQPYKIALGRKEVYTVPIPQWVYWCSRRHIEWHSETDPSLPKKQTEKLGSIELGYMNVYVIQSSVPFKINSCRCYDYCHFLSLSLLMPTNRSLFSLLFIILDVPLLLIYSDNIRLTTQHPTR